MYVFTYLVLFSIATLNIVHSYVFLGIAIFKEEYTVSFLFFNKHKKTLQSKSSSNKIIKNESILHNSVYSIQELKRRNEIEDKRSNEEIVILCNAYHNYRDDGDINKCIKIYEDILLRGTSWNSFNYCMTLANLYYKSNQYDKAWGFLNWTQLHFSYLPSQMDYMMAKIRFLQFKILKSEKRYLDALEMLLLSYLYNVYGADGNVYFNKSKFFKESQTTAKQLKISKEELLDFIDEFELQLKRKHMTEDNVRSFLIHYIDTHIKTH